VDNDDRIMPLGPMYTNEVLILESLYVRTTSGCLL